MLTYERQVMFPNHGIFDHQEIIEECKGCKNSFKRIDGKIICSRFCFPHTQWWFGIDCSQTTHTKQSSAETPTY